MPFSIFYLLKKTVYQRIYRNIYYRHKAVIVHHKVLYILSKKTGIMQNAWVVTFIHKHMNQHLK